MGETSLEKLWRYRDWCNKYANLFRRADGYSSKIKISLGCAESSTEIGVVQHVRRENDCAKRHSVGKDVFRRES